MENRRLNLAKHYEHLGSGTISTCAGGIFENQEVYRAVVVGDAPFGFERLVGKPSGNTIVGNSIVLTQDAAGEGFIFRKTKYRPSCKKDLQRYILQNTQPKKTKGRLHLQPTFRCIVVCGVTGLRALSGRVAKRREWQWCLPQWLCICWNNK